MIARSLVALLLTSAACTSSQVRPSTSARTVDRAAMDTTAVPGEDFYAYANGTFLKNTEIPADKSGTGAFLKVAEEVERRTRALAESAADGTAPEGSDRRKIGDLYATYLDEASIEAKGFEPLQPELARIAALADKKALSSYLGSLVRADVDGINCSNPSTDRPLGLWVEQDLNVPERNTAYFLQGGLGMPVRSFYLDTDERAAALRTAYAAHLAKLFTLIGQADGADRAARVLALEVKLAQAHATPEDSNDASKSNHPVTRAQLEARAPGLDWAAFLEAAQLHHQDHFILWQPSAVVGLAALVTSEPLALWKDYLAVRAVDRASPYLAKAFADERFAFYGTALSGVPSQAARWRRGLRVLDLALGEPVGRLYAERHFPESSKTEVKAMVEAIRAAFSRRIDALEWMSPATKARAQAKLRVLEVGIGYPDTWHDYSGLSIVKGDLWGDVERASRFHYEQALRSLSSAPNRGEWCMLPHEVNAVNLPIRNALHFPAGIMEAPFYDRDATAAVKYAAIGAVIGHELSHSFDNQGALFDEKGQLANWWTPADLEHFQAAGASLAAQYDTYRPFPDVTVNGKLTLGENIADLAGLAAAYDAWKHSTPNPPEIDGLTGDQQFFLSFAQTWQSKTREKALRARLASNPHAPAQYRALTVRNLDAWYSAFDVQPGQALYLEPAQRVRVW